MSETATAVVAVPEFIGKMSISSHVAARIAFEARPGQRRGKAGRGSAVIAKQTLAQFFSFSAQPPIKMKRSTVASPPQSCFRFSSSGSTSLRLPIRPALPLPDSCFWKMPLPILLLLVLPFNEIRPPAGLFSASSQTAAVYNHRSFCVAMSVPSDIHQPWLAFRGPLGSPPLDYSWKDRIYHPFTTYDAAPLQLPREYIDSTDNSEEHISRELQEPPGREASTIRERVAEEHNGGEEPTANNAYRLLRSSNTQGGEVDEENDSAGYANEHEKHAAAIHTTTDRLQAAATEEQPAAIPDKDVSTAPGEGDREAETAAMAAPEEFNAGNEAAESLEERGARVAGGEDILVERGADESDGRGGTSSDKETATGNSGTTLYALPSAWPSGKGNVYTNVAVPEVDGPRSVYKEAGGVVVPSALEAVRIVPSEERTDRDDSQFDPSSVNRGKGFAMPHSLEEQGPLLTKSTAAETTFSERERGPASAALNAFGESESAETVHDDLGSEQVQEEGDSSTQASLVEKLAQEATLDNSDRQEDRTRTPAAHTEHAGFRASAEAGPSAISAESPERKARAYTSSADTERLPARDDTSSVNSRERHEPQIGDTTDEGEEGEQKGLEGENEGARGEAAEFEDRVEQAEPTATELRGDEPPTRSMERSEERETPAESTQRKGENQDEESREAVLADDDEAALEIGTAPLADEGQQHDEEQREQQHEFVDGSERQETQPAGQFVWDDQMNGGEADKKQPEQRNESVDELEGRETQRYGQGVWDDRENGGEAEEERSEKQDEFAEGPEGEATQPERQDVWKNQGNAGQEEEKQVEQGGIGDEEDEEISRAADLEALLDTDEDSPSAPTTPGDQPYLDLHLKEAVQRTKKDEYEDGRLTPTPTQGALLQEKERRVDHEQGEQQRVSSLNKDEEPEGLIGELRREEQKETSLEQNKEMQHTKQEESRQRQDATQDAKAANVREEAVDTQNVIRDEGGKGSEALIEKHVEAESRLLAPEMGGSADGKKHEGQDSSSNTNIEVLPRRESEDPQAQQKSRGDAEADEDARGDEAEGPEPHASTAPALEAEQATAPDKAQQQEEEVEETGQRKKDATVIGKERDRQHIGGKEVESSTGRLESTEVKEAAEQSKNLSALQVEQASQQNSEEAKAEEKALDPSQQQHEVTEIPTKEDMVPADFQRQADEAVRELSGLISSLEVVAKRFEEQQRQLEETRRAGRHQEVHLREYTEVQKQEQLLKENEERLPALLQTHAQLLKRLKENRHRILRASHKNAGFLRGTEMDASSSRELMLQHQHTDTLINAFTRAADQFGTVIQLVNESCNDFIRDHDRALQVVYEYGRAIDLLNMGIQMNELPEDEVKEQLRACSEAFSVLSRLLSACDTRMASILEVIQALEAQQGLSIAALEQLIQAQEQSEAGNAVSKVETSPAVTASQSIRTQALPALEALRSQRKQLAQAARHVGAILGRLGISVAEAMRAVVSARAHWMEDLLTQLLRHFDGLVTAGKHLHLRGEPEEHRRRLRLSPWVASVEGKRRRNHPWDTDDVHAGIPGIGAEEHLRPGKWTGGRTPWAGTRYPYTQRDAHYFFDKDGEEDYEEASHPGMTEFRERPQRKDRVYRKEQLKRTFRRRTENAGGLCVGRAETDLLRDINGEGWKAVQNMAEGTEAASKVARDAREAMEKEIVSDRTTVILGTLLGLALLLLLALVIYGYYMVFSYEERVNAYRIGNKTGQAVDATGEAEPTSPENERGRSAKEGGLRRVGR